MSAFRFGRKVAFLYLCVCIIGLFAPDGGHPPLSFYLLALAIYPSLLIHVAPYVGLPGASSLNPMLLVSVAGEYFLVAFFAAYVVSATRMWRVPLVVLVCFLYVGLHTCVNWYVSQPEVALRYIGSVEPSVRENALAAVGDRGGTSIPEALLKQLERSVNRSGVDFRVVIAVSKIGKLQFWIDYLASDRGQALSCHDWVDILEAIDRGALNSGIGDLSGVKSSLPTWDNDILLLTSNVAKKCTSNITSMLTLLWCTPALRESYMGLVLGSLESMGSQGVSSLRFLIGLRDHRVVSIVDTCNDEELKQYLRMTKEERTSLRRRWEESLKTMNVGAVLPFVAQAMGCFYGSDWGIFIPCMPDTSVDSIDSKGLLFDSRLMLAPNRGNQ